MSTEWKMLAYAQLGRLRDSMTPEAVAAVQDFLGPLAASPQPAAQPEPTVLPDGSAFAVASYPLPKDHWLYAPRGEWDNERDAFAETPRPILNNSYRQAVIAAIRYAVRGATMCGQEMDFDPDAMVQNACYALCGPANGKVLPVDAQPEQPEPCGLTDECILELTWGDYPGRLRADDAEISDAFWLAFARAIEREVLSTRKNSDAEVARIMEAVDEFARQAAFAAMGSANNDDVDAARAEVERLLRGEA